MSQFILDSLEDNRHYSLNNRSITIQDTNQTCATYNFILSDTHLLALAMAVFTVFENFIQFIQKRYRNQL